MLLEGYTENAFDGHLWSQKIAFSVSFVSSRPAVDKSHPPEKFMFAPGISSASGQHI